MNGDFPDKTTAQIAEFLASIGLSITSGETDDSAFLPGITVAKGGLMVDESKLLYPGDLLHEAGHLAVVPSALRKSISGEVEVPGQNPHAIEAASISWSYAACIHIGLDPRVVFHEHGYHGRSEGLLFNFALGVFPGLHELVSAGMTDAAQFPEMKRWLRK